MVILIVNNVVHSEVNVNGTTKEEFESSTPASSTAAPAAGVPTAAPQLAVAVVIPVRILPQSESFYTVPYKNALQGIPNRSNKLLFFSIHGSLRDLCIDNRLSNDPSHHCYS